jgi:peptidoglycan hydrolase-like protein with peptidoglycan-binding domain
MTTVAAIALALGGLAVFGSPASAAMATCTNKAEVWSNGSDRVWYQTAGLEPSCNLKYGNHNDAVLRLQDDLNFCYGPGGQVAHLFSPALGRDSDFGPATQGAVRAVQRQYGLSVDGQAGPATRSTMWHPSLNGAYCAKPTTPIWISLVYNY